MTLHPQQTLIAFPQILNPLGTDLLGLYLLNLHKKPSSHHNNQLYQPLYPNPLVNDHLEFQVHSQPALVFSYWTPFRTNSETAGLHIPLTYLTDKHCAYKKSTTIFHDTLVIDETSRRLITASKPLSDVGELKLTFEEWHQAWRRLLPLIKEFLPDDYDAWNTHFLTIRDKETL